MIQFSWLYYLFSPAHERSRRLPGAMLYAAEEVRFSQELRRWASCAGLEVMIFWRQPYVSSGRRFRLYSRSEIVRVSLVLPAGAPFEGA